MTRFLKDSDPRFHLVELRSKTFVALLILVLAAITGFAAFKQEWFRSVKPYWMLAETSESLQPGMAVRLSGFRIGRVKSISLKANRQVKVDLEIFDEYTDYVRGETIAKLRGENLIGDHFIELWLPTEHSGAPPLAPDSRITFSRGKTIDEFVESLEKKFTPILTSLATLAESLPDTAGRLDSTLDQANGLITDLRSDEGHLVSSLKSLQHALSEIDQLASDLRSEDHGLMAGISQFNETAATVNRKVEPLIDSLQSGAVTLDETAGEARKLFVSANEMIENLNQVVKESSGDIPKMVHKGADAADKADDVMDSVRRMWPVRQGVSDGSDQVLQTGSDD
ncbi:MlaD family protein [Haloferula rosea]|uniref:MCE family protein n=1 Tax=Haloferula rosea TaxID=490093 RepID=A0A934RDB4_9BACT|nr:MlaD family protein [Haloferula rosea]MBK1826491.1 MCE family protein [Haloferula rosea]